MKLAALAMVMALGLVSTVSASSNFEVSYGKETLTVRNTSDRELTCYIETRAGQSYHWNVQEQEVDIAPGKSFTVRTKNPQASEVACR